MEKINIAELLKDCPLGMELDCTIWDSDAKVFFKGVLNDDFAYPIVVTVKYNNCEYSKSFSKYGAFNDLPYCKCVIFPKGKTSWEGFQMPFNDGDIIYKDHFIAIVSRIMPNGLIWFHCWYNTKSKNCKIKEDFGIGSIDEGMRFATEEEKAKLFDAIKANGYKWNTETKTLEKLVEPKFKVGDIIKDKCNLKWKVINENGHYYEVSLVLTGTSKLLEIKAQDDYELVPKKFDITTLKPFDSRVLVRHNRDNKWCASFFSHIDEDFHSHCNKFVTTSGKSYPYCIPYEGNEHLLNTTNDCDEFYRNL